jgi:hypothetical protein
MSFVSWIMALSFLLSVMVESIRFHKATVCRQEAWLMSFILISRDLIPQLSHEQRFHQGCHFWVTRHKHAVFWGDQKKRHQFKLKLQGKL